MIAWSSELMGLAELVMSGYPDLTESELKLLCAATSGNTAYCGPSFDPLDPSNDPTYADSWGPERSIRAYLIRVLCIYADTADYIMPSGIVVVAARIEGDLDLQGAKLGFPIGLLRCRISNPVNLSLAQIEALSLSGSVVAGIMATGISVRSHINLTQGFRSEGEVRLIGASIGSDFDCRGGRFSTDENPLLAQAPMLPVLVAHRIRVGGSMYLGDGFCAEGSVGLIEADIGGSLHCDGGHFMNPGGRALYADGLSVRGGVFFRRASVTGEMRLNGARVRALGCDGGRFINPGGYAINADGIHVEGTVHLRNGFYSEGEVCLVGGSIAGSLECDKGKFTNPRRMALNADHTTVGESVLLRGCVCTGQVRLMDGKIGGSLNCIGGIFQNPEGHAIEACRVNVAGDVSFAQGFRAIGVMHMRGAQIRGTLACPGGLFVNPGNPTLDADGTMVGGNVLFHSLANPRAIVPFRNDGIISLVGTHIRGNLEFLGAVFGPFSAVNLRFSVVEGAFYWKGVIRHLSLAIHLEDASVGSLEDDKTGWPSPGNLHLDGFTYDRISSDNTNPDDRLRWLRLQNPPEPGRLRRFLHGVLYGGHRLTWRQKDWPDFRPQPYQQLSKALRELGDNAGAKRVLVEMEDSRRKFGNLTFRPWVWRWILKGVIGYGYRPGYALICALVVIAFGSGLFWYNTDLITPTDRAAYNAAPSYYQPFSPIVYSIDTFLPIINLGQKDRWTPNANHGPPVDLSRWLPIPSANWLTTGWLLRLWLWVQTGLGWLLTTLFVAGLTPIVRNG
jgi:hypothetical protein